MGLFFADFVARVCFDGFLLWPPNLGPFVTFSAVLVGFCMLALLLLTRFHSIINFVPLLVLHRFLVGNHFRMTVSISTV